MERRKRVWLLLLFSAATLHICRGSTALSCVDAGFTDCCVENCQLSSGCFCNQACYEEDQCCSDIASICSPPPELCGSDPCQNEGICVLISLTEYTCQCMYGYTGDICQTDINFCDSSPCLNDGTCTDGIYGFSCECPFGFTSRQCEVDIDECSADPCGEFGTCTDGIGEYICMCSSGYTGVDCDVNINDCDPDPCINGTCIDKVGGYMCECNPSFAGANCSIMTNCSVEENTCENNGICNITFDGINRFPYCMCLEGYTGDNCEIETNECSDNPCINGGTCLDLIGEYSCICPRDFTGINCSIEIDFCDTISCENGAVCREGECFCRNGFTGIVCEINIDDCLSAMCFNNATCIDEVAGFTCQCTEGYTGEFCNVSTNTVCSISPCFNNGTCHIINSTEYQCICPPQYTGINCSEMIDFCLSAPCIENTTQSCINTDDGFECMCIPGYEGEACETDQDACMLLEPCANGGVCIDMEGLNYTCACTDGYEGINCGQDINECLSYPCQNNGTCVNEIGQYRCVCSSGYSGQNCSEDVDSCLSLPCQNDGVCIDLVDGFECMCRNGFTGNTCEINIDNCSPNPCRYNSTCINLVANYSCECAPGYDGRNCTIDIDLCDPLPCMNGATCTQNLTQGTIECMCATGYQGLFCQSDIDECNTTTSLCLNGGQCVNTHGGFYCDCPLGFSGLFCEDDTNDDCIFSLCMNNATCIDTGANFECICPPGYTGLLCDTETKECDSDPCQNNGLCLDELLNFTCVCTADYTGRLCDINLNPCSSEPCLNEAECINGSPGSENFSCVCAPGFTGPLCEEDIDDCTSNPCLMGSTCLDAINGFICLCAPGFNGSLCDNNYIDNCAYPYCLNGGTCVDIGDDNICICDEGFHGPSCEYATNECLDNPCLNDGICRDLFRGYECMCVAGFTGQACEFNIDDCLGIDCHNGTCVDLVNTYICNCTQGYAGDMCEMEINECLDVECMFGGSCIDGINNYTCECTQGFQGRNCEENINDCVQVDCGNGTCIDLVNDHYCECVMGYTGPACEDMIDECNQEPCMNNGSCVDQLNNFTCLCTEGFTGHFCETNIDDCIGNDCLNGATCLDGLNDFTCDCVFGYTGDRCEMIVDLCYDGLCANNGTCNTTSPGITECTCTPLYSGPTCDVYIDLCLDPDRCMNGGDCITTEVNGTPSFTCNCTFPFVGITCESFNPCAFSPCTNFGTCTLDSNNTMGYQCDCLSPFLGYNCLYSDLCAINLPCSNGGACTNHVPLTPSDTTQSISCECSSQFTGTRCEIEITPCYYQPCDNGATCLLDSNTQLGYTCQCPLTWQGINCTEEINIVTPSFNGASFIAHNVSISSSIEFNYSMALLTYNVSGLILLVALSDFQDYIALGLESGQLVLYFKRESDLLFQLESQLTINDSEWHIIQVHISEEQTILQVDDEIETVEIFINSLTDDVTVYVGGLPDYSLLIGTTQTVGLVGCVHDRSANGQSVELNIVPHEGRDVRQCIEPVCQYIQCQNGAECRDNVLELPGFTCDCLPFYSGVYCETPLPFCEPNPCLFGGQCREEFLTFSCRCPLERAGRTCGEDISITVPSFTGESYIAYPILSPALQTLTVTLTFSPITSDGLLFFTSTSEMDFSDYFSLALVNGHVEFRYNLGSGAIVIQSETDIELNRWHAVTASLSLGRGELTVDNDPTIVGAFQSIFTVLNTQNLVWLGGYANFVDLSPITGTGEGFKGCVLSMTIDDSEVDLIIDADYGLDVTECNTSSCSTVPCMNGGTCIDEGPSFVCQCPQGVYGALCSNRPDRCASEPDLCADGATCMNSEDRLSVICLCPIGRDGERCDEDIVIQSPQFNTTSYLQYNPNTFGMQLSTVEITFNTSSDDGLLFYYGDQNDNRDFLSIVLIDHRVEYRYDLGSGPAVLISDPVDLNVWHYVSVTLDGPSGTIIVDGSDEIVNDFEGQLTVLNAAGDIFVGGVSDYNTVSSHAGTEVGLTGCISDIQINGVDVDLLGDAIDGRGITECYSDPCTDLTCNNGGSCVVTDGFNVMCACTLGFVGSTCDIVADISVPYFTGQSYLEHNSLVNVFATTTLTLEIRPSSLNGLILYNQQTIAIDYIAVLLRDGMVEFRYDLGSGEAIISSRDPIELDEWHIIEVYRSGSSGQLIVDEQLPVTGVSLGTFTGLTLGDPLFIGGVSDTAITDLPSQIREVGGYQGCIRSIVSNTVTISLVSDANNGVGVEECPLLPCTSNPCLNNGVCFVEFGNGSSNQQCLCSLPFTGDTCAERVEDFPEASFNGQSYLEFSATTINVNIQRISTSVEITFTPYHLTGLLYYMGPADVNSPMDYLYIGLSEGLVELRFDLGSGEGRVTTSQPLLAGETYTIIMNRNGASGMLSVSNGDSATVVGPFTASHFDYTATNFAAYLGGAPSVTSLTGGVYSSGFTGCVSTLSIGQVGTIQLIPFISAITGSTVYTCS